MKWHDGQPFTAKDVKYTFDVVREAADAPARLRLSPRKEWYANVEAIETPDPFTVGSVCRATKSSTQASLDHCVRARGFLNTDVFQPASRYWLFQGIEAALFSALALALLALAVWWVRRRLARADLLK